MEHLSNNYVDDLDLLCAGYADAVAERITRWFFENYEDPAETTPCDEGEYVYIWGGPCETRDIIENALDGLVPDESLDEIIEAALRKIDELGCGDICVPLFGRYDPDDINGHAPVGDPSE